MHKILIVDDNEMNRAVLSDALDDGSYELYEAEDGLEALEKVQETSPDLVLMDIEMPHMDGVQALKKMKEDKSNQNIPVIMVTALNTDAQVSACLDAGAIDHIVKPFSNMVVRARVRAALRSQIVSDSSNGAAVQKQGRIITFLGSKGGVGTTTVALNVAATLAKQKKSVIACELRPDYGTALAHLNASPALNLRVLLDEDSGKITQQKIQDCLENHAPTHMRILLGPQNPDEIIEITDEQVEILTTGLINLAETTILELPCTPWEYTNIALRRSDYIVLVVDLEPASLVAAAQKLSRLKSLGVPESSIGIVANHRTRTDFPVTVTELRQQLSGKVVGVIPSDPEACFKAIRKAIPITISEPDCATAGALTGLANRLTADTVAELEF